MAGCDFDTTAASDDTFRIIDILQLKLTSACDVCQFTKRKQCSAKKTKQRNLLTLPINHKF